MNTLAPVWIDEEDDVLLEEEPNLDEDDLREIARLHEMWEREERAAAQKEVAQNRRDRKEAFLATGCDIRDYCHDRADSPESAAAIAADLGYHSSRWDDASNVTRRAKEAQQRAARGHMMHKLKVAQAMPEAVKPVAPAIPFNHPAGPQPVPQPGQKVNLPDVELAEALGPFLVAATKGLGLVKGDALRELAKARINNRPVPVEVSNLPIAARRDLEDRLRLAIKQARGKMESDRLTQQLRQRRRDAANALLVPVVNALGEHFKTHQAPGNGATLTRLWESVKWHYEKQLESAAQGIEVYPALFEMHHRKALAAALNAAKGN